MFSILKIIKDHSNCFYQKFEDISRAQSGIKHFGRVYFTYLKNYFKFSYLLLYFKSYVQVEGSMYLKNNY